MNGEAPAELSNPVAARWVTAQRWLLAALVFGLAAAFVVLAREALTPETLAFDRAALAWIASVSPPGAAGVAAAVSFLGSEGLVGVLIGVVVVAVITRRWPLAIGLLVAAGGAQLLNDVIKAIVQRPRPAPVAMDLFGQVFSFPSGHAMVIAAVGTVVGVVTWRELSGWRRAVALVFIVVAVLAVGLSRLVLGVHYPTDVVAGYLAGVCWAVMALAGIRAVEEILRSRGRRGSTVSP